MGKPNRILELPTDVRKELDDRLRAAAYGDLLETAAWITTRAFPVSKSSLHRYAVGLRATDAARGRQDAQVQETMRLAGGRSNARRSALLQRLGEIELERAQILAELLPLWKRDDPASMAPETGREPAEPSH